MGVQAADLVFPALGLPSWIYRSVVVLALLGFPIAVLLAWAFELTLQGVQRTGPEEAESGSEAGETASEELPMRHALFRYGLVVAVVAAVVYASLTVGGVIGTEEEAAGIRSLAVLPLENLAPEPEAEAWFADGMTEALTARLARIEALKVTSRTSAMQYRNTEKKLPEVARELGVDALIEGSVLQAGDDVRITLQLVHGSSDRHLWANSYERELRDILALQGEVAQAIAEEIQLRLAPEEEARLAIAQEVDPEAYRLWLKGNFHLSQTNAEAFRRALDAHREAVEIDPDYPAAYAGIALAYVQLGSWHGSEPRSEVLHRAKAAAERALALDSTVAEAHMALAHYRRLLEWDWEGADRAFRRGIELNPSAAVWRIEYANFLISMGRFEESIEVGRRTLELDPLSPVAYNEVGFALTMAGSEEKALKVYRESLEIDPDFPQSHTLLAGVYAKRGESGRALSHLARIDWTSGSLPPVSMGISGYLHAEVGRPTEARDILSRLMERRKSEYVPAVSIAYVHLGLGQHEKALRWLEKAMEERNPSLVWLKELWLFDPLRDDPRFQDLIRRMNFPET